MTRSHTSMECPWCWYDLHAHIHLDDGDEGLMTCPECGGQTDTHALRKGATLPPRWSLERPGPRRAFPWQVVRSMTAMLNPIVAWRRLQPEQALSRRRLAALVCGCLAWMLGQISILAAAIALADIWAYRQLGLQTIDEHEVLTVLVAPFSTSPLSNGYTPWDYTEHLIGVLIPLTGLCVGTATVFAASLLLLPVSRRRAGASCGHLVRLWAYALPLTLAWTMAATLSIVAPFYFYQIGAPGKGVFDLIAVTSLLLMGVWSIFFWYSAVRWYLRLPHAAAITALHGLIAFLVFLTGMWLVGEFLLR